MSADQAIIIRSEGGQIDSVIAQPVSADANPDASFAKSVSYAVSGEQTMLLTAVCAMLVAEAQIILVSRDPASLRAENIIGVVTSTSIARFLQAKADLL